MQSTSFSKEIFFKILVGIIGFLTTALVLFVVLMATQNIRIMATLAIVEAIAGIVSIKTAKKDIMKVFAIGMTIASVLLVAVGFLFWNIITQLIEGVIR